MIDKEREERLLDHALTRGVLKQHDLATSPADAQTTESAASTLRYGPRIDRLLASGKITEGQVERLLTELSGYERTLDGTEAVAGTPGPIPKVSVQLPSWLANWTQYEVRGLLGQGGMGMVYRARDRRLSRDVALKFISVSDPLLRKRFLTEARAQARLNHENICKVFEVGEVEGHPYIAMELVEGQSLASIQRSLNREQKLMLLRDIAQAIHSAHCSGVIHRDLKPSNILSIEKWL